ncbi:MAG: DUF4153 domain-containing protein [Alphaproteobacteria bacterium]|nr:DUF4153 domain-containing protein [Alphaproteobacteria bacterium]
MNDSAAPLAFRNLLSGLLRAPLRFPVTLSCALGWAAVTIAREHRVAGLASADAKHLQVLFMTGLFLSLAATLFAEGRGWKKPASLGLSGAAVGFVALVMYAAGQNDAYESPAFYLLGPGAALLVTVAPFLRRGADSQAAWTFNLTSWVSALFGLIVAVALGLGLMAFFGGLETLFGLNIRDKIYEDVWIVCMSVVWPWQTLAGVPGRFGTPPDGPAPRWAEYLVSWLLAPLAVLYLLLLCGFAAKVLVTWNLPRGTIGWLVGGFAAYGLAVWSAAHPMRESGNPLVRLYYRYFHFALFVPVLLLAVGVGARVAEYGVTEKRYALILLTVWLAGIALYGVLRRPALLTVAPASFAALLIVGSFGPWGASSISLRSQLGQLEALLTDAGILIEGRIEPEQGLADQRQVRRISNIVGYMRRSGKLDDLEGWLAAAGAEPGGGETNHALLAHMGLDYVEAWERAGSFSHSGGDYETFEVAGFDIAHRLSLGENTGETLAVGNDSRRYRIRFDGKVFSVTVVGQPDARVDFDLDAMAEKLASREIAWDSPDWIKAMTLDAAAGGLRARLLVEHMSGQSTATGNHIDYGRAVLLLGLAD